VLREAGKMKRETLAIADIYVPVKRRATRDQNRVNQIAASILEKGQQTPILVRADGARFVLIEGLHRLEAAKALRLLSVYLSTRESTGADARWFCLPRSAQINT
jgi:sulfiredoxin